MAVVLIVEDEEQVRVLAESILQDSGHRTLSAATKDEALALIQAEAPIHILFTDINLAQDAEGGSTQAGLELAREAVTFRPGLRVLYTTGQGVTDGMKALFVESGEFLPKPYDLNQLAKKVADLAG